LTLRVSALAFLAVVALPMTVSAQDSASLRLIQPAEPIPVEFAYGRADLTLVVANTSTAAVELTAGLFDSSKGIENTSASPAADGFAVTSIKPARIEAASISQLAIRVMAGPNADSKFSGLLILTADGVAPLIIAAATPKAESPFASARAEPASITVTIDRKLPSFWPFSEQTTEWLYIGHPPELGFLVSGITPLDAAASPVETRLSSDTGGRLQVAISGLSTTSKTVEARLAIKSLGRAGKYSGDISVASDESEAPKIALTVNVEDLFVWPLAALLLGVCLAFWFSWQRGAHRQRSLLTKHLSEVRDRYLAQRDSDCSALRSRRWMRNTFRIEPGPNNTIFDATGPTLADQAYGKVIGSKTAEALKDAERLVRDLDALVSVWADICRAATRLGGLVRRSRSKGPSSPVLNRARQLLGRRSGFKTAASAEEFLKELIDQAAAIELYQHALDMYELAIASWSELRPGEKEDLAENDPEVYWETDADGLETREQFEKADPAAALAEINRKLLARLRNRPDAVARLMSFARDGDRFLAPQPEGPVAFSWLLQTVNHFASEHARQSVDVAYRPIEHRTTQQILTDMRILDLIDFFASGGIAVALFLITLYPDKNFGTGWQYLGAILAGAGGTLVINWQLLPWFRSYSLPKEDKAS
jgi:hypothetical protein